MPNRIAVSTYLDPDDAVRLDDARQVDRLSRAAWVRTRIIKALADEAPPLTDASVEQLRAAGLGA